MNFPDEGSTSKPLGVPNYSMEMQLLEDKSDSKEILESIPVGCMGIQMDPVPLVFEPEDWRKYYPMWQQSDITARPRIGDCHVMMMEYQLTVMQPYLGDNTSVVYPCHPSERFTILCLENCGDTFKI